MYEHEGDSCPYCGEYYFECICEEDLPPSNPFPTIQIDYDLELPF